MAFYIHLGCELDGREESNCLVDMWIHMVNFKLRLDIMEIVLGL
jgi:hypothetical protein